MAAAARVARLAAGDEQALAVWAVSSAGGLTERQIQAGIALEQRS